MPEFESTVSCIDQFLIQRAGNTVTLLRAAGLSVVTAESCTGGLISAILSQAEGAGEVLEGGFVVYSKTHKTEALAVDEEVLRLRGAVNAATAEQMVAGALNHSQADIALGVTGVLGPDPDEDDNPVGLVYMSAGRRDGPNRTEKYQYGHQPHDALRRQVILDPLALLDGLIPGW